MRGRARRRREERDETEREGERHRAKKHTEERAREPEEEEKRWEKEKVQEEASKRRKLLRSKELERWMQLRAQDDEERLKCGNKLVPVPMRLRKCRACFKEVEDLPHVMLRCMAYNTERSDFFGGISMSRSSGQVSSAILELRNPDGCDRICQAQNHFTQECTGPCSAVMDWLLDDDKLARRLDPMPVKPDFFKIAVKCSLLE